MKLLVFGGRDYLLRAIVVKALDHLHARIGIEKLVQGGAQGADRLAFLWGSNELGKPGEYTCHAEWDDLSHPDAVIRTNKYGKQYDMRAGMRRNARMLKKYPPTHALQFPGGVSTFGMRSLLDKAGIPVFQVYSDAHDQHVQDARDLFEHDFHVRHWHGHKFAEKMRASIEKGRQRTGTEGPTETGPS